MKKVLVTGGCGFIGHHIVEHILKNTDWNVKVIDKLTYASNGFDRLRDINVFDNKRVQIYVSDFSERFSEGLEKELNNVNYILHIGAETHVDNSIKDPEPFVFSNVVGTLRMLEFAKTQKNLKWFIYFSTDEVFGPAPEGIFYKEWDRYNSTNPYSATKAGGEELCLAYGNTYKLPVFITHTMNVFGERQHPEKFIPKVIKTVLKGETIPIHSDSTKTKPGSRHWIHARNVANAILFLLEHAEFREKYNIVGEKEVNNLEMAQFIAQVVGRPLEYKMVDFHSSRPGHDLRYGLDGSKLKFMGFEYPKTFEQSLEKTIKWTLKNQRWLNWK
ncbi:MAG: NAD-dependent epimerase/dehydratase family protein [Nanoarchaeota archaeon]